MYLIDTDVISEIRKRERADPGVAVFFRQAVADDTALYLSAITIGELRHGVEIIRRRGDGDQADNLEQWLTLVLNEYSENVLPIDAEIPVRQLPND